MASRECVERPEHVRRVLKRLAVVWGMERLRVWLGDSVLGGEGQGVSLQGPYSGALRPLREPRPCTAETQSSGTTAQSRTSGLVLGGNRETGQAGRCF